MSAGRALGHDGVLSELVTQLVDVEFARHAADFDSCRKSRPSSVSLGQLLYNRTVTCAVTPSLRHYLHTPRNAIIAHISRRPKNGEEKAETTKLACMDDGGCEKPSRLCQGSTLGEPSGQETSSNARRCRSEGDGAGHQVPVHQPKAAERRIIEPVAGVDHRSHVLSRCQSIHRK